MTKDDINAKIQTPEAQLAQVRRDLINGPQGEPSTALATRREELMTEIAALNAMLDEL